MLRKYCVLFGTCRAARSPQIRIVPDKVQMVYNQWETFDNALWHLQSPASLLGRTSTEDQAASNSRSLTVYFAEPGDSVGEL